MRKNKNTNKIRLSSPNLVLPPCVCERAPDEECSPQRDLSLIYSFRFCLLLLMLLFLMKHSSSTETKKKESRRRFERVSMKR
eukprot:gene11225-7796_t